MRGIPGTLLGSRTHYCPLRYIQLCESGHSALQAERETLAANKNAHQRSVFEGHFLGVLPSLRSMIFATFRQLQKITDVIGLLH
jgi:hypothetical protein